MNEANVSKFYNDFNGKTVVVNGKNIKIDLGDTLENFKEKMNTPQKRRETFNKMWGAGFGKYIGKSADFEKKYGGTSSAAVGNGKNIQKLIDIDDRIKETTDPNQAIRYHQTQRGVTRVKIFFNDGRYLSREGTVNNRNNEITGTWYFRGDDNYQVKYGDGGVTRLFDFKSGMATQVADTPPVTTQTATGINPILQKLMKIDENIKKTTSPDQVVRRLEGDNKNIWIFYSDGNFRLRFGSVNNKNKEFTGRWKFIGENDYQINTNDGDEWLKSRDTWKSAETNAVSGKTWRDVTFTLADVAAGKAVLKKGDKGPAVEELQKLMIQMNLSKVSKSGQPDGKFGKLTELSIRQFQGEMKYGERDGKVGKTTLNRMYYVYNYDPDKEVDDEQTQVPTGDDSPEFLQSQLDSQNANKVNSTTSSQPATQTTTAQPAQVPQAAPTQPETPTQTKKKPNITPDALNEEDIRKIVSENLKSLVN
jgi:hypothetical protein